MPTKLYKPTIASCAFILLLVAQLREFGVSTQCACVQVHDMSNRLIDILS